MGESSESRLSRSDRALLAALALHPENAERKLRRHPRADLLLAARIPDSGTLIDLLWGSASAPGTTPLGRASFYQAVGYWRRSFQLAAMDRMRALRGTWPVEWARLFSLNADRVSLVCAAVGEHALAAVVARLSNADRQVVLQSLDPASGVHREALGVASTPAQVPAAVQGHWSELWGEVCSARSPADRLRVFGRRVLAWRFANFDEGLRRTALQGSVSNLPDLLGREGGGAPLPGDQRDELCHCTDALLVEVLGRLMSRRAAR